MEHLTSVLSSSLISAAKRPCLTMFILQCGENQVNCNCHIYGHDAFSIGYGDQEIAKSKLWSRLIFFLAHKGSRRNIIQKKKGKGCMGGAQPASPNLKLQIIKRANASVSIK